MPGILKVSEILPEVLSAIVLVVALYTDLRYGKIYNKLTLPTIALGVILSTVSSGWHGLLMSIGGVLVVLVPFLVFAPLAGIGGGDAKLMMAIGSLLGAKTVVWVMLYSAIAGGVLALIVMARYRAMMSITKNMLGNLYLSTVLRAPVDISSGSRQIKFRYTPAIALGTLLACFLRPT